MKTSICTLMAMACLSAASIGQASAETSMLIWADAGEPVTIDPVKANIDWELNVTRNVYDALTTYGYAAPDKILPALALEWTNDGKAWTFRLRDGVKFHDGKPFTAEDVKASIDRFLAIGQGQSYLIGDVTSVTVLDPLTVRIETKAPNVYLPANLSHIEIAAAADIAANQADKGEAFFGAGANGTGPYKFVSWTRGAQIELARNEAWWGTFSAKPFDRVIDRFVGEGSNRARGLEGGEYDLANYVPHDEALRISGQAGFTRVEGSYLWAWPAVYLNTKLAPTDNADFRKALVKAFDYGAMNEFYGGLSMTPSGPVPSWYPGSPEKDLAPIAQDMKGAKALLDKSGQSGATMKCVIPAGFPEFAFATTVLQASAAAIGVTVEVEEAPFAEAIAASKDGRSNCFAIGNANLSPTDATKFFAAHYVTGGFFNTANYSNPEFDALVETIPSEFDDAKRYALMKTAAQTVIDAGVVIWTARPTTVFAVPDRVAGYAVNPTDYTGVRFSTLSGGQ